jgi:hypothetical protein
VSVFDFLIFLICLDPSDDMFELISGFHWGHKQKNRPSHHSFHGRTNHGGGELFGTPKQLKEPFPPFTNMTTPGNNGQTWMDSLPDRPYSEKSVRYESFKDLKRKRYGCCLFLAFFLFTTLSLL